MNEASVREHAEKHAASVVNNDSAAMLDDFVPDALAGLGEVAAAMPSPVEQAEVQSVTASGEESVVRIHYSNGTQQVVIESVWTEHGGRPRIKAAKVG